MTYIQYQYVFRHLDYGLIDKKVYDEDLKLKEKDFVKILAGPGELNCSIYQIRKILDNDRNMIIYILYIQDTGTWLDDELE
jgi:hypothetical protein